MTKEQLIATINGLNRKGGAFYGFETVTNPKIRKMHKVTKERLEGVLTVHAVFSAMVGISYENAVNNRLEKMGEERNFEAQKPSGMHHIEENSFILQSDKNPEQFYLALSKVGGMKKTYYLNGKEASPEQVEDITKNWFYDSKPSEFKPIWRTFKVEGIISVK